MFICYCFREIGDIWLINDLHYLVFSFRKVTIINNLTK